MIDEARLKSQYLFYKLKRLLMERLPKAKNLSLARDENFHQPIIDCIITMQNANHQIMTLLIDIYVKLGKVYLLDQHLYPSENASIKVSTVHPANYNLLYYVMFHNASLVRIFIRD